MKKTVCLMLIACLLCAGAFGCALQQTPEKAPAAQDSAPQSVPAGSDVTATITMENGGVIVVELYPDIAPQSVYNFVSLARSGFYDGLTFHRIIKGFMIQGGDPNGDGKGNPGYFIKGEFSQNGVENNLLHERGVISMARRAQPYDSAGSQFFIVHEDHHDLDGAYAGFGRVISGMEVVDEIADSRLKPDNQTPRTKVVIKSITIDGPELPEPDKLPA